MSVAYRLICRPTIGQHIDQHYRPICQLTLRPILSRLLLDTSVNMSTQSRSTDMATKSQPTYWLSISQLCIEGCTNRPFPSSRKSHFQTEAKCETFVVKMSFICIIIKNHFHINGFALSLALKVRFFGTQKWPITQDPNTLIMTQSLVTGEQKHHTSEQHTLLTFVLR